MCVYTVPNNTLFSYCADEHVIDVKKLIDGSSPVILILYINKGIHRCIHRINITGDDPSIIFFTRENLRKVKRVKTCIRQQTMVSHVLKLNFMYLKPNITELTNIKLFIG